MKIIAIGQRSFINGFRLAGINGIEVLNSDEAYIKILELFQNKDIGLILISSEIAKAIKIQINEIRSNSISPIIYEIPTLGSKIEKIQYHDLLKTILKI